MIEIQDKLKIVELILDSKDGTTGQVLTRDSDGIVKLITPILSSRITITGIVNGANNSFTALTKPTWVVSDGVWYEELDSNSNVNWSWSSGTITTIFYPQSAIWGFK